MNRWTDLKQLITDHLIQGHEKNHRNKQTAQYQRKKSQINANPVSEKTKILSTTGKVVKPEKLHISSLNSFGDVSYLRLN